jgi:hypothetical protein
MVTMAKKTIPAEESESLGVLWGAEAIARFVDRDEAEIYYLLQKNLIDADKVGDLWVSTKDRLRRQFGGGQARPRADAEAA